VSTHRNLDDATVVTQQDFDINKDQIDAWIANPTATCRLIVAVSRPVTSSQYVPVVNMSKNHPTLRGGYTHVADAAKLAAADAVVERIAELMGELSRTGQVDPSV
jgi:hypothetical protein